jgi:hypothetical protein
VRAPRWIGVALAFAGAGTAIPGPSAGQDVARLVRDTDEARIRLAFPARPGVCGTGDGILIREADGSTLYLGRRSVSHRTDWREGDPPCEVGNVAVDLERDGAAWSDVDVGVVPVNAAPVAGPGHRDLGIVGGQAAVDFLLAEGARADPRIARELLFGAALADDAVAWPGLLDIARDRSLPDRTRRSALRWLGREAAAEAVRGVGGIIGDRTESDEIREAAVFALSRLPDDRAVPLLIDVARTSDDARVRGQAFFWLAGFDDPRVTALFEEILGTTGTGPSR